MRCAFFHLKVYHSIFESCAVFFFSSACLHVCVHIGVSQVGGCLPVLPLSGLSHSHIDALQPLLSMFLILSFQHVRLIVSEDLKGPRQTPIAALLGYNLLKKEGRKEDDIKLGVECLFY